MRKHSDTEIVLLSLEQTVFLVKIRILIQSSPIHCAILLLPVCIKDFTQGKGSNPCQFAYTSCYFGGDTQFALDKLIDACLPSTYARNLHVRNEGLLDLVTTIRFSSLLATCG